MANKFLSESTILAVDITDAARMLSLSERTVARLAKNGVIPSAKLGRRRVFVVESLKSALADRLAAQAAG
jgi:excisionase family DNA binding protein